MKIPVLIELDPDKGFRARAGEPFAITVEGATHAEVLKKLQQAVESRVKSARVELTELEVPVRPNGILRCIGTLDPNDPEIEAWKQAMQDYRREVEEAPDGL